MLVYFLHFMGPITVLSSRIFPRVLSVASLFYKLYVPIMDNGYTRYSSEFWTCLLLFHISWVWHVYYAYSCWTQSSHKYFICRLSSKLHESEKYKIHSPVRYSAHVNLSYDGLFSASYTCNIHNISIHAELPLDPSSHQDPSNGLYHLEDRDTSNHWHNLFNGAPLNHWDFLDHQGPLNHQDPLIHWGPLNERDLSLRYIKSLNSFGLSRSFESMRFTDSSI